MMSVLYFTLSVVLISSFLPHPAVTGNSDQIVINARGLAVYRDAAECIAFAAFTKYLNKHTNLAPLNSIKVGSYGQCLLSCVENVECFSVNVATTTSPEGTLQCQSFVTRNGSLANNVDLNHYSVSSW